MKILVISGFLGAGKTTFIKTMSEKTGRDFVVFENEYAQADIDKALLSKDSNLNIWELTENCICCSGKQDFASTILTISNTLDPEFLLVEPTGVAKLSSILQNIKGVQYERISILKPVTILDGTCMERQIKEYSDIYLDQIKTSDQIVVSKMEHVAAEDRGYVTNQIEKLNPCANILDNHYSMQPVSWWEGLLKNGLNGNEIPIETTDTVDIDMENMTLLDVSLPSPTHLISFLEMVCFGVFGKVCRAKGFLPCGCEWLRFDIVDRTYSITGIEKQEEARTVFIGKNLYRAGLREMLQPMYKVRIMPKSKANFDSNGNRLKISDRSKRYKQ